MGNSFDDRGKREGENVFIYFGMVKKNGIEVLRTGKERGWTGAEKFLSFLI